MKSTKEYLEEIRKEIEIVHSKIIESEVEVLIKMIINSDKIVVCGAGRVGMAIKGFGMRLGHMGLKAFTLGDSTVPHIGNGDLLIVASGSGETKSILEIVKRANLNEAKIALISGNKESSMGAIANHFVKISAPSKTKSIEGFSSIQPMTTLNEQSLSLFFDAVSLKLMDKLNETHDTMWARHSNLE